MSFINRKKGNKVKSLIIFLVVFLIVAVGAFISLSPTFEKNPPKISLDNEIYWNLKEPLKVKISDDYGIKSYRVLYSDGQNKKELQTKVVSQNKNEILLNVFPVKYNRFEKPPKEAQIYVEVTDSSKWNFFKGNVQKKLVDIKVDRRSPYTSVINNSYMLKQGGSATVVVKVEDENLDDFYITLNNEERFELIPFYKENYYMAIIAWPVYINEFRRVNLVAIDKAGNRSTTKVPYYIKSLKVKADKIKLSDNFINNVSRNVLEKSGFNVPNEPEQVFVASNSDLREANVETIKEVSRTSMDLSKVSGFNLKAFRQLRGSKNFAGYADRRHYYYNGQKIDEAWHLGMDWASIKQADVYATNPGKVIYKDYLGIYGNTAIIDHGFGLASLYAHTSNLDIENYDYVDAGQKIANTGATGAVFGDHLHFGILVQGIEVNPLEWMDRNWISINVTKILERSKKVIDSK